MVSMRRFGAITVLCSTVALAGCTATDGSSPSSSGAASGPSAGSASAAPAPTDAAGLTELVRKGVSSVTSAHLTLSVSAAGQTITGEGDEKIANGTVQALDMTQEIASVGKLRLIVVDGATYMQLPAALNQSGKPWLRVTSDSSKPELRQLATLVESTQSSASLDQFAAAAAAASQIKLVGNESLDGVAVNHYSIIVDVTKLPSTMPGQQTLLAGGVTTLPTELYIDSEGRPVKITQNFTAQGQPISTVVTLSKFNEPVSITAPPADQVSTS